MLWNKGAYNYNVPSTSCGSPSLTWVILSTTDDQGVAKIHGDSTPLFRLVLGAAKSSGGIECAHAAGKIDCRITSNSFVCEYFGQQEFLEIFFHVHHIYEVVSLTELL